MYYALTATGLDKVEAGLKEGTPMNTVLGALADLEESDLGKPHTIDQMVSLVAAIVDDYSTERSSFNRDRLSKGLNEAARRGYVEEIQHGDERFPDFK